MWLLVVEWNVTVLKLLLIFSVLGPRGRICSRYLEAIVAGREERYET
jgi:hypothetical protein